MNWNNFRLKLRALIFRDRVDHDLDEELALHVELETRKNLTRGMDAEEARRRALVKFGGVVRVAEECRDARGINFIDGVIQDIRYGFRTLRKNPGFTAVAVMILALGIGVNTAVFTVTNAMLFGGMPGVDPSGRVLYLNSQTANSTSNGVSYLDFEDWRAQSKSFADMAAVHLGAFAVNIGQQNGLPGTYDACELSTNAFQVLGQRPALGRDFVSSDATPGAVPVTILSYGLWTSWYGRNPAIIGQKVRINDVPTEVIGVMPPGFEFPMNGVSLWLPLVPSQATFGGVSILQRDRRRLMFVFGRMAEGVTVESARAEMETIGNRLALAYPETNRNVTPRVRTFTELFVGLFGGPNAATTYWAMWSAVGFVLLIACANVANLMLARAIGRTREISLRSALGAGRWRVVRQLLIESVMLSAMGGVAGLAIAALCLTAYQRVEDSMANYMQWAYTMDSRVFTYLLAISLLTGLLFGLAPALRLSRLDINAVLKDGGRGATGGQRRKHLSSLLVMGEMALAVVLLAGAGVLIRSFLNIYTADRGIKTTNILTTSVWLPDTYSSVQAERDFWERLTSRLQTVPGVEAIALASSVPGDRTRRRPYEVAGAPTLDEKLRPALAVVAVSPDYFQTLGARVLSGRPFKDADGVSGVPVAIVNERFAAAIWPGEDALGKRLRFFDAETPEDWRTVVGLASNIVQNDSTAQKFEPVVYVPFEQEHASEVFVRTAGSAGNLRLALLTEIYAIDANVRLGQGIAQNPRTLDETLARSFASRGVNAGLFLVFAAVGLVLAAVGLYAVVAHSVGQRTQEIGIRVAMGATAGDIRRMVLRQGMMPLAIGLIVGLAASFAVNRFLESQLVGVSSSDPLALSAALALLVMAGFLGCWIPARRAMHVDPAVALRHD